jgi:Fe2+ transport system protein FeoA
LEPPIEPLSRLRSGDRARIVHLVAREGVPLVKLATLGLIPGTVVRLVQRKPAVVLEIGHTTLALDEGMTSDIFVARLGEPGPEPEGSTA